ncbi:type II toxin-antitoxin system HicA family toxin [bacterium]|nr:type II toxin-antitoxin system HicA family toxin [bacterium]MBU3955425.1 type II toxin-antitoxin system HicA family toxin [bacterium]
MAKLPVVSAGEVIQALNKKGFKKIRQSGSHIALQKLEEGRTNTVIVPDHRELAKGTLRAIIRKAGLTVEDFLKLL